MAATSVRIENALCGIDEDYNWLKTMLFSEVSFAGGWLDGNIIE
jgi:hypothetical protein